MTQPAQAPADSPEVDTKPGLASDAPEQPSAAAPSEPKPESTDGEEAGAEDQPTTPWWREETIESEEGILAHESLQPILEERDNKSFKRGRSETHGRMQGFLETQTTLIKSIDVGIQQFVTDWQDLQEDADKDTVKGLNRLLRTHKPVFDSLRGLHQEGGRWSGAKGIVAELGSITGDPTLFTEFGPRLDHLSQGDTDPSLFSDLLSSITKSAQEAWEKVERPKLEAQIKKRLEAQARNTTRQDKKPPVKPAGGGGGTETSAKSSSQVTGEQRADAFEKKHGYRPRNM